ncbi:alpha/beta hydrolase [Geochorda subterranea]|uniref:Alpha/beta fold hydrolase n=1 Tax=Geochorda subterranea TaxID=3109564 RepID=A0ABZ1BS21_9FIRM|nr:alpha/beta fold hydrolase [Limnochorda sp. LNt]WRP15610.1 alpha/beta fold hydrolase [Limnochorda sp. LNt]
MTCTMEETPVCFTSEGEQIIGVLHRPPASERTELPVVVMCHGFTGHKVESHRIFVKTARALARRGVAALRFDFRGSGDSAGEFDEMTVEGEVRDALAAMAYVRRQVGGPVALLGMSLGGMVATLAAQRDGDVAALVLWAAVARPERLARRIGFGGPEGVWPPEWEGRYDLGGHLVSQAFVHDLIRHDPLAAARTYPGPVLVLHGRRDETVPPDDAEAYLAAFSGTDRTLRWIEGADHTFNRTSWEREVIEATVAWLAARLAARP